MAWEGVHCCVAPCAQWLAHVLLWLQVWQITIALYLVGTLVWNLFATGERVFD